MNEVLTMTSHSVVNENENRLFVATSKKIFYLAAVLHSNRLN